MIEHVTDHYALAVARLPMVYQDKPRFLAWLAAYCERIQNIEDAMWDFYTERCLQNNPTGDLLAKLGSIVGQTSMGLSDTSFRLLIMARIATNRSDGRKGTMIKIGRLLTDGLTIQAYDLPHTSFYLQPMGPVVVDPYVMYRDFLNRAIGAGVRLTFVWTMVPLTQTLTWGSVYGGVTPTTGQSPGSIYVGAIGGGVWAGAPGV